jgi:hypothetical protein
MKMQDQIDSQPGKLKSLIRLFVEDHFLKRLKPYIKFNNSKPAPVDEVKPVRKWPASEKDSTILQVMEEVERKRAEE